MQRGGVHFTSRSCQIDGALDLKFEVDAADCNDCLRRQTWAILQLSVRDRISHRLLDLPLGGHAERLEKFTYAGVESFLVHDRSFADTREARASSRNTCGTDCAKMCSHGIRNRRNVSKLTRKLQFAPGHRRPDGDNSHYHSVSFRIIPSYILRLILWQVSHLCSHYALLMIC